MSTCCTGCPGSVGGLSCKNTLARDEVVHQVTGPGWAPNSAAAIREEVTIMIMMLCACRTRGLVGLPAVQQILQAITAVGASARDCAAKPKCPKSEIQFTAGQVELCVNELQSKFHTQTHTHTHTHIFSRRTHVPRSTNGCRTTCGRLSRDTKLSRRGGRSRHEGAATPTHRHSAYTAPNRGHEQSKGSTPRRDAIPLTHTSMNTKDVPPSASLGETRNPTT